jgi:hypothetical protein
MEAAESKSYQLRVRVTAEERDRLEKLRLERGRGETISDLVREAISLLVQGSPDDGKGVLSSRTQHQVERLAVLLKREPRQVEEACVEGIIDMIESKCEVPLIVMETHLHLKYRGHDEKQDFPWSADAPPPDVEKKPAPAPEASAQT